MLFLIWPKLKYNNWIKILLNGTPFFHYQKNSILIVWSEIKFKEKKTVHFQNEKSLLSVMPIIKLKMYKDSKLNWKPSKKNENFPLTKQ